MYLVIDDILFRLRKLYGAKTNKDLAVALELSPSRISRWNTGEQEIPTEALVRVSIEKGVSMDWLLFGKEQSPALSDLETLLLNSFKRLDEGAKLRILSAVANGGEPAGVSQTNENGANNYFRGDNVSFNEK